MSNDISNYNIFLDKLFVNILNSGIKIDELILDHIAYRPLTAADYEQKKLELNIIGTMISEVDDSGRKISIFRLNNPFKYKQFEIQFFELLGPKTNNKYPEGYQHIEFVINCSLEEFIGKYQKLNFNTDHIGGEINPSFELPFDDNTGVEFHLKDIGEVIRLQNLLGGGIH